FVTVFSFAFQWFVLKHLPVVDCLPYKIGNNIPEKMQIPAGAIPDSTVITFQYEYKGNPIEFTAEEFPEDFNDTDYTYIGRYDKIISKCYTVHLFLDFSLLYAAGNYKTLILLVGDSFQLYLFFLDDINSSSSALYLNITIEFLNSKNNQSFLVTNAVIN